MRLTLIATLALLATLSATAANAQAWQNSAGYNGYGAMNQNTAANYSLRDQNGKIVPVVVLQTLRELAALDTRREAAPAAYPPPGETAATPSGLAGR